MDAVPIGIVFTATVILVLGSIELGYRVGRGAHRKSEDEKESPVSAIAGTILGLLAFILAFTFGLVSGRYDDRKELVREEAIAIRVAWSRSDFLPEPDRGVAKRLLADYTRDRLLAAESGRLEEIAELADRADRIHTRLWDMAVDNARRDMDSDVAALYVEALNDVVEAHWLRVAVGLQMRIPTTVWVILYVLVVLAMSGVGYQIAIAGSRRTLAILLLALSFSLVISLIGELDRARSAVITVSQQPLRDLHEWISARLVVADRESATSRPRS